MRSKVRSSSTSSRAVGLMVKTSAVRFVSSKKANVAEQLTRSRGNSAPSDDQVTKRAVRSPDYACVRVPAERRMKDLAQTELNRTACEHVRLPLALPCFHRVTGVR
jgi:hypothetical protein